MNQSDHREVAEIYQRVLKGQKGAITNLQKIGTSPLKKSQKIQQNSIVKASEQQQISQDLSKASKSQNFRKYLKQKVAELGSGNQPSKKQVSKNQKQIQKKQYAQPKPFSKVRKRSEIQSQKKTPEPKEQKLSNGPPVQKTKTTSNNFQQNIKRNVIKDSVTQKDRQSTPPSSKHSFRIRAQGGSKKLLEQLMRLNEEQKSLQYEILQFHKQHKDTISQVCQKYGINHLDSHYKTLETPIEDDIMDSPSKGFLKLNKGLIGVQQSNINKLQRQIIALSKQIDLKKTQVAKKQAKIQGLPLFSYMNQIPDIFQQRQSEEQAEEVGQLPQQGNKNMDPTKTYQSVMTEMRKKKWGLNQRVNYESEGQRNEPKQQIQKSPPKGLQKQFSPMKMENDEGSKIVVNSRLKQFLFE